MPYIISLSKYLMGVEWADKEHAKIIDLLNKLYRFSDGNEKYLYDLTLDFFVITEEYETIHFYNEEKLMEKLKYPKIEEHIEKHRLIADKLDIIRDIYNIEKKFDSKNIYKILSKLIMNHINKDDRVFFKYYKKHNSL